jgi:hypothetical protein
MLIVINIMYTESGLKVKLCLLWSTKSAFSLIIVNIDLSDMLGKRPPSKLAAPLPA